MATVTANGIQLEYEVFGEEADPALLLIMGLGAQLTAWDADLCHAFADRGFRVIRYDNRDCGLSQKIDDGSSYLIDDMADDAAGLLDALGITAAHVVGASMGGMIAQALAIKHPSRVRSLTSIMSTTGDPSVGGPTAEALAILLQPQQTEREARMEQAVAASRVIAGDTAEFPFDPARARRMAEASFDRSFCPDGMIRQLTAIQASPDRTQALGELDVPALVIHGTADCLVGMSGGEATAKAIPGADLLLIDGMGHSLPPAAWPQIVEAVTGLAARSRTGN